MKAHQWELPVAGDIFNLVRESGEDPVRAQMDQARALRERELAQQYQRNMQRLLEECPGFAGCDAPASASCSGKVVVDPGRISDAMPWLKRRFHVSESLELSTDAGLCVEIKPRERRRSGARRVAVRFGKPEQFTFNL